MVLKLRLSLMVCLLCLSAGLRAETILVLGDSLTAGDGVDPEHNWVSLVRKRLIQAYGGRYELVNAGISGNTTSNGLQRLPALLDKYKPTIIILSLGSNDGLRGLALSQISDNLEALIAKSQEYKAQVLLIQALLPLNYGPLYRQRFAQIFKDLSKRHKLPLIEALMSRVASNPDWLQSDGLHPNEAAQAIIAEVLSPQLMKLLPAPRR